MTDAQLKALQGYVTGVARVMTNHDDAHAANVRYLLDRKRELERAFGLLMPVEHDYPDLFAEAPTSLPDLL